MKLVSNNKEECSITIYCDDDDERIAISKKIYEMRKGDVHVLLQTM